MTTTITQAARKVETIEEAILWGDDADLGADLADFTVMHCDDLDLADAADLAIVAELLADLDGITTGYADLDAALDTYRDALRAVL